MNVSVGKNFDRSIVAKNFYTTTSYDTRPNTHRTYTNFPWCKKAHASLRPSTHEIQFPRKFSLKNHVVLARSVHTICLIYPRILSRKFTTTDVYNINREIRGREIKKWRHQFYELLSCQQQSTACKTLRLIAVDVHNERVGAESPAFSIFEHRTKKWTEKKLEGAKQALKFYPPPTTAGNVGSLAHFRY